MRAALAGALLAGVAIGGCGGPVADGRLATGDATTLRADVGLIRAAAAVHNAGAADSAAAKLQGDVGRLVKTGRLSAADGRLMLLAVAQVDRRISVELQAPAAATASPPAGPPAKGHGHGPPAGPPAKGDGPGPPAKGHGPGPGGGNRPGPGGGGGEGDGGG